MDIYFTASYKYINIYALQPLLDKITAVLLKSSCTFKMFLIDFFIYKGAATKVIQRLHNAVGTLISNTDNTAESKHLINVFAVTMKMWFVRKGKYYIK